MKTQIESAFKRRISSPEAKAKVKEVNDQATNWRGTCRICGAELTGTLAELLAHKETHGK